GQAATPGNVVHGVTFSVDGAVVSSSTSSTSSLGVGASRILTASTTWKATAGTHTLLVRVDDVNRIAESNETNNTRTSTFTVSP
ncbi:MAG TPA: CARDB domain-containing protein, partial [Polyangia bacterium]|nr:CARDB domain-containing protein [Polyangia bacterium]